MVVEGFKNNPLLSMCFGKLLNSDWYIACLLYSETKIRCLKRKVELQSRSWAFRGMVFQLLGECLLTKERSPELLGGKYL